MTEYETERVHEAPVTTVRITPRDTAGGPRHPWAYTFQFDEPVFLATARYYPVYNFNEIARNRPVRQSATVIGAFLAESYPADPDNIQALTYALWQRWRDGAGVEAWAEIDTGSWMYMLIPAWYSQVDTRRWTVEEPDHREPYAVGRVQPVDTYPWPEPCPFDGTPIVKPASAYVMGVTPVPPPAPGYTNILATNTVKGTPT